MSFQLSDNCFHGFVELIHRATGISISSDRKTMVEGRIRRRVASLQMPSYEAYLKRVESDSVESKEFIDLITTNETYFFRTPRIWKFLEETFLPSWFAANPNGKFRAWSAAASSGEEAHSLGVLCEAFKETNPQFRYQIVGSDISKKMIQRCNSGQYTGRSILAFRSNRQEWFSSYMETTDGETFQVSPNIKQCLRFREHNLFQSLPSHVRYDLILLRNVLIYFSPCDQQKVISLVHPHLAPQGRLIIGESETLAHITTPFKKEACYIYAPIT